jgi:hypothetical protein
MSGEQRDDICANLPVDGCYRFSGPTGQNLAGRTALTERPCQQILLPHGITSGISDTTSPAAILSRRYPFKPGMQR